MGRNSTTYYELPRSGITIWTEADHPIGVAA